MSKNNSFILICFVVLSVLSGCGVKKDLYQTPTQTDKQTPKTETNNNKETSHYQ